MSSNKNKDVEENIKIVLGEKEEHESYGMLRFSRVHCGSPVPLFGSSIKHNDIIHMELCEATTRRSLNEDWYFSERVIAEVEMSSTQFSDLITSLNMGSGVPVTIKRTRDGKLKTMENPPFVNRSELHKQEFNNHLEDTREEVISLADKLSDLYANKKTLKRSEMEETIRALKRIERSLGVNMEFQIDQFDRFMEKSRTEAKGEIEAFFQNTITNLAKKAIEENPQDLSGDNPISIE